MVARITLRERSAKRSLASISVWIEKHLKHKVNAEKKRHGTSLAAVLSG